MPKKPTKKTTASKEEQPKVATAPALSRHTAQEIVEVFYQVVGDLRNVKESKTFLLDFLTDSERLTFAKRLAIGLELQSGKSYDTIRKEFGVSSATISMVAEMSKSVGMQLALKKVSTEKWATQVSGKFFKFFGIQENHTPQQN